jgi:hypothetical protein
MKRIVIFVSVAIALIIVGRMAFSPSLPVPSGGSASVPTAPAKDRPAQSIAPAPLPVQAPAADPGKTPALASPAPPEGASRRPFIPHPDPPDSPAKVALNAVALNLRNYGSRFGGNPTGSNPEITKTLNGDNPARAKYLPVEHTNISPEGELLDFWGTPYFFHQQSGTETVIRSAGPDRKLFTVDDITAK